MSKFTKKCMAIRTLSDTASGISVSSFWLCESIVANPIIYRLIPRPSRFETRQWWKSDNRGTPGYQAPHVYEHGGSSTLRSCESVQTFDSLHDTKSFHLSTELAASLPREYLESMPTQCYVLKMFNQRNFGEWSSRKSYGRGWSCDLEHRGRFPEKKRCTTGNTLRARTL